jgi:hypothetical protein
MYGILEFEIFSYICRVEHIYVSITRMRAINKTTYHLPGEQSK